MNLLILSLLFSIVLGQSQSDRIQVQYANKKQGLCAYQYTQCPSLRKQKFGVCCRLPKYSDIKYFPNFCLACKAGCQSFTYKLHDDEICQSTDL